MNLSTDEVKPGLYLDMTDEQYHQRSHGWSSSNLKTVLNKSYLHMVHDKAEQREATPATLLGKLLHTLVLEPEKEDRYVVQPQFKGKGAVAARAEWQAANSTNVIITQEQLEAATAMRDAVMTHPTAGKLFEYTENEVSVFNRHESGEFVKVRPDALSYKLPFILDLKSTSDANFDAYVRQSYNLKYHLSAAMYLAECNNSEAALNRYGHEFSNFIHIVVENKAPYGVRILEFDVTALNRGMELYNEAIAVILENKDRAVAEQGYPVEIGTLFLPPWAK